MSSDSEFSHEAVTMVVQARTSLPDWDADITFTDCPGLTSMSTEPEKIAEGILTSGGAVIPVVTVSTVEDGLKFIDGNNNVSIVAFLRCASRFSASEIERFGLYPSA